MAIYRKCKYCGQPISLREMPAGQWVAFDLGTDNVHGCVQGSDTRRRSDGSSNIIIVAHLSDVPAVNAMRKSETVTRSRTVVNSSEQVKVLLDKAIGENRCVRLTY